MTTTPQLSPAALAEAIRRRREAVRRTSRYQSAARIQGRSAAAMGWPRFAPIGLSIAEADAWLRGYDEWDEVK